MKKLYNFNEFKKMNEETFNDSIKNVFSATDKDSGNILNEFIKKIDTIPDPKNGVNILKETLKRTNDNFTKNTKDNKNIQEIQGQLKQVFTIVFTSLEKMADKYKIQDIKPAILYKQSNNKLLQSIFVQTDMGGFQKNLDTNINSLVMDIAKQSGMDTKNLEKKNESLILEADVTTPTTQTTQTTEIPEEQLNKFKDGLNKFMMDGFIGPLTKKLDETVSKNKTSSNNEIEGIAKNMKGSTNLDSKKNFITAISNIQDPNVLNKIRDLLVSENIISKDDAEKMKF